eukprot:11461118-Alexandrium_andersonii.AAC.1
MAETQQDEAPVPAGDNRLQVKVEEVEADPEQTMEAMLQAQKGGPDTTALEIRMAMTQIVGEFRTVSLAVQENQKATLGLHQQFLMHQQQQQATQKGQETLIQNMQQQINELKQLVQGTSGQPPYPNTSSSVEAPTAPAPVTPPKPITSSEASSPA